jgi:hypothetical protein
LLYRPGNLVSCGKFEYVEHNIWNPDKNALLSLSVNQDKP